MTRRQPSRTQSSPAQIVLFAPPAVSLVDLDGQIRETLADTLAGAKARLGLDRHAFAAEMNRRQPGAREVSKNMLDRWCAQSAEDWQLPASRVPVICLIAQDYRLLELIAEASGHKAIPGQQAVLGELALAKVEQQQAAARVRELERAAAQLARGGR